MRVYFVCDLCAIRGRDFPTESGVYDDLSLKHPRRWNRGGWSFEKQTYKKKIHVCPQCCEETKKTHA